MFLFLLFHKPIRSPVRVTERPHSSVKKNLPTLLPIHFEWGDVTLPDFSPNCGKQSGALLAFQAAKVEQCSTFEASEASVEASANQTACMLGETHRRSFPHIPKNGASFNARRCVDGP